MDAADAAARLLHRAREAGRAIDALPAACRPATRAEGYAAQACWPAVAGAPGAPEAVVGWKIAATSAAGQAHIGVDGPLAGRVLASRAHADGATVPLAGNRMRVAEPEFGFVLARDLPPREAPYALDEVLDAVGAMRPIVELPDSRLSDFARAGAAQLLADCACAGRFVLGAVVETVAPVGAPAVAPWRALDLAAHRVRARVLRAGRVVLEREGGGDAVLGDPRIALAWIANELSAHGVGLGAGQFVSTGTCMPPVPIERGDRVEADWGVLGRVSLALG